MLESLKMLREIDTLGLTSGTVQANCKKIADAIQHELDEGWAELPKDADGEYVHIGDRVENNKRVVRIVLTDGSWEPSVYVEEAPCHLEEYFCNEVSHYHEPTVEQELGEMHNRLLHVWQSDMANALRQDKIDEIIAEYAKKLCLADDGKEQ